MHSSSAANAAKCRHRDVGSETCGMTSCHTTAAGAGDCGTSFTALDCSYCVCKMNVLYIVKVQAAPKNQTLKLRLPYDAIPCTIVCHTAQTSFLRRDFWYLNRARAASSPRALLNPFAPFSAGQRIVYVLYEHSYRICVSLRLQNKFSIWLLAKASSLLACCEHWTNFDCATDLARIGNYTWESNSVSVSRPNVINWRLSMEYFWLPALLPRGKLTIASSFAIWLW